MKKLTLIFSLAMFSLPIFAATDFLPQKCFNEMQELNWMLDEYQDEWISEVIDDRIYIKNEAIALLEDNFFIFVDSNFLPMEGVEFDSVGHFICRQGFLSWTCCRCQTDNSYYVKCCQVCYNINCSYRLKNDM
jgi:hypothetical protein